MGTIRCCLAQRRPMAQHKETTNLSIMTASWSSASGKLEFFKHSPQRWMNSVVCQWLFSANKDKCWLLWSPPPPSVHQHTNLTETLLKGGQRMHLWLFTGRQVFMTNSFKYHEKSVVSDEFWFECIFSDVFVQNVLRGLLTCGNYSRRAPACS